MFVESEESLQGKQCQLMVRNIDHLMLCAYLSIYFTRGYV